MAVLEPSEESVVAALLAARAEEGAVVLEGFHALKHALRFGADVVAAATSDRAAVRRLAQSLAPDLADGLGRVPEVSPAAFAGLGGRGLPSPVLAVARRPVRPPVAARPGAPTVLLHEPRHLGNAGAVVRVAAAAGAARVAMTGAIDPWAPPVVRAAAGLHFAVDVVHVAWPVGGDAHVMAVDRRGPGPDWGDPTPVGAPVVAFDPDGDPLDPGRLEGGLLVFGSERHGLPPEVLASADHVVALPMTAGVSSLNLATTVSAALYLWRLSAR